MQGRAVPFRPRPLLCPSTKIRTNDTFLYLQHLFLFVEDIHLKLNRGWLSVTGSCTPLRSPAISYRSRVRHGMVFTILGQFQTFCILFQRLLVVRGKLYELLTNCIPANVIMEVTVQKQRCVSSAPVCYLAHPLSLAPHDTVPSEAPRRASAAPSLTALPCTQTLVRELLPKLDISLKRELCHWAAFYVFPTLCCPPDFDICNLSGIWLQEARMQRGNKEVFHLEAFVAKVMAMYKKFLLSAFG